MRDAPYTWNPPAPRQLPTWRRELVAAMSDPNVVAASAHSMANGFGLARPANMPEVTPSQWAEQLHSEEAERLAAATLYYATAEPTRLAVSVAGDFAHDHLAPDHAPASAGLIVFEEPIGTYVGHGPDVDTPIGQVPDARTREISIVAVSWGPHDTGLHGGLPGLWFTLWSPRDYDRQAAQWIAGNYRNPTAAQRANIHAMVRRTGPLMWDNEWIIPYAVDPVATARREYDFLRWINVVRASWMLMRTPTLAETATARESKTDAKRGATTSGTPREPAEVQVITMRTRATSGRPAVTESPRPGGGRSYSWQWTVKGHTREQPYGPNRSLTKRIWIEPHLQGPEDKPLKPKPEIVNLWKG